MKKNVSGQKIGIQMVSATDGSAFTGAVTIYVTGDAGTQGIGSVGGGACVSEGNGYHTYAPAQAETNYDLVAFTFIGTGAIPATVQVYTSFPQTGDSFPLLPVALVGGKMDSNVSTISGVAVSTTTAQLGVNVVQVSGDATAADNLESYYDATVQGYGGQASYSSGFIYIDTGAGAAGTTNYVHGTITNPNSSMANSRTLANALDIKGFRIANSSSITLDQGYIGFNFVGDRWTLALASRDITSSHFVGATVTGLSTGTGAEFDDCLIGTSTIFNDSFFSQCGLTGTLTLGAAGIFNFAGCFSVTTAGVDAIIDFGALGATTVGMRDFHGGLEVRNMAAGDVIAFTGGGRLTIAASCTGGTVNISGPVNLVNSGSGQTISDTSRWNEDQNITNVTGTVAGFVAGAITAAAIATDAIDNDAIAANAVTEIQAGLATAASIVTVQADTDAIQVVVAAIQAKTDNLPADPADASDVAAAFALVDDTVWDAAVDGAITARQSLRLQNSAAGAKLSGAATTTVVIRDIADTKDRVTATVDSDGNRTAVTRDLT